MAQENVNYKKANNHNDDLDIDIGTIIKDLRMQWLAILLVAIGGACFMYFFGVLSYNPVYTVSTVLSVSNNSSILDSSSNEYLTRFSSLLSDNILKNKVAQEIGTSDYTVTITPISETNILTISVAASSPHTAFVALRSLLNNYPLLTDKLLSDVSVTTLQQPKVSGNSSSVKHLIIYSLVGFAMGAVVVCAIIALCAIIRDTVKSEKDFEKIDSTLLGTIFVLKNMRKKEFFSTLITNPLFSAEYVEQYYMATSRIVARMKNNKAKTLLVTSAVPNEGKTTTVLNVAISLAQTGKKVLVIGADIRNPSIGGMIKDDKTLSTKELRLSKAFKAEQIGPELFVTLEENGVNLLYNDEFDATINDCISNGNFQRLLKKVYADFDYILLDSGPVTLVSDTELLSYISDACILVVHQDIVPVPVINDVVDMLEGNEGKLIGCIYRKIAY